MSGDLRLLSAGAAQGVANALAARFRSETGARLNASYMPVGAIAEALFADSSYDVVVSTPAMLEAFARDGRVDRATIAALGRVHTGIAVRAGEPAFAIDTPPGLADALSRATRIFVPDPDRATAGIHFVKVLRALGLYETLAARLVARPNGASAMAALASETGGNCLGCTQVTEIRNCEGVALVGVLPPPFDLATPYAGAACASARDADLARRFVATLAGAEAAEIRRAAGFET